MSIQTHTAISISLIFLSLLSLPSQADLVTNLGAADPSGIIEQLQANVRISRAERNGGTERIIGQTFYAPQNFMMSGLALKVSNARDYSSTGANATTSQLQVKVIDMGVDTPDVGTPDTDNVTLATLSYDVSALSFTTDDWVKFDFDTPLALNVNELYGFMVFWDGENANNTFDVRNTRDLTSVIAGSDRSGGAYVGTNWETANPFSGASPLNQDLAFMITQIPEPSTLSLVLLGVMGMLCRLGRRGRSMAVLSREFQSPSK